MSQDATKQAHQKHLEELFSKNQLLPRIRKEFEGAIHLMAFVDKFEREVGVPREFCMDLLVQLALHKRADMKTMVGLLRRHFGNGQVTADALLECCRVDLCDWDGDRQQFVVRYTISDDVQLELDKFQYPLPMVVPPRIVKSNKQSGYITSHGSLILRNNHHEEDICLDHINRMNQIPFEIDEVCAHMVKNQWRNLDKPNDGETEQDFTKRVRAFEKYDRTAKDVIDLLIKEGNLFYLTHKYDKRGRTYSQGYHVNYQGAPWNKAVITFHNKELIE